jgi:WD40 repeat protein
MKINLKLILLLPALLIAACNASLIAPTLTVPVAIENPTQTAAPLTTASPSRAAASTLPFLPSPTRGGDGGEVDNVARLQEIAQMKTSFPSRLIWSLDGQSLGVITQSGFSIFSAGTWQLRRALPIQQPAILLDLAPDLRAFAHTTDHTTLDLRDTSGGLPLRSIKPVGTFGGAVFSPDARTIATTSMDEIAATLWDVSTGQQIKKADGVSDRRAGV